MHLKKTGTLGKGLRPDVMAIQKSKFDADGEELIHYFLCRYIPRRTADDRLSQSLIQFKNGVSPHRQAWVECALAELKKITALEGAMIIRALNHDELSVPDTSHRAMDELGTALGHSLAGWYLPAALCKIAPTPKLSSLSLHDRREAMKEVYRFMLPRRMPPEVLVLNDIVTSGTTVRSIVCAIRKVVPDTVPITLFTLAATDYYESNADVDLHGEHYKWVTDPGSWLVAEKNTARYGSALTRLKRLIMEDAFYDGLE
jgi:hypothetical protein